MAIKEPKKANYFWTSFHAKSIILTVFFQVITAAVAGLLLIYVGKFKIDSSEFIIIISIIFLTDLAFNLISNAYATNPTRSMIAAVSHILGQQTTLPVPDANSNKNNRTGLGDALRTILGIKIEVDNSIDSAEVESLKSQLSIVTNMLDTTTCGFVAINSDRKITYTNKAAPSHVNTENITELDLLFSGDDALRKWIDECENNSVRGEHIWTRIPDSLPNQENRRFFDVVASYEKGRIAETILVLIDRTSLYSVDEENLDFLSFAAHELRGPITVIRGYLDVLEGELADKFEGDQHELFRRLIVSSTRLSGYIDNILNTSRYDRRHLKVNLAESTVDKVYDVIKDDMMLRAGSQNRLLAASFPSNLPTIAVDLSSMSEVIGNLIDNAIKYSNEGGTINVTAAVNGDFVDISIQDHGIGMPESVVSNLFQKFYRSHRSRETVAGTGIGLYISKAIVESHGGRISVRSEDGKGSIFIISIPIYATVADKLQSVDNSNERLISQGKGWIKNHSMYRG